MQLSAKRFGQGQGTLPESFHAEAEASIMLQAFENELDALLTLIEAEGHSDTVSEAIYRRFISANELFESLQMHYTRVGLKIDIISEQVLGGFGARDK